MAAKEEGKEVEVLEVLRLTSELEYVLLHVGEQENDGKQWLLLLMALLLLD